MSERGRVRLFSTGATRSDDGDRPLYTGYFSPLVMQRYGSFMTRHRVQADGGLRDPDNWQRGMPLSSYLDGLFRHFVHLWLRHEALPVQDPKAEPTIQDDLCAVLFNAQGMLHEILKAEIQSSESYKEPK